MKIRVESEADGSTIGEELSAMADNEARKLVNQLLAPDNLVVILLRGHLMMQSYMDRIFEALFPMGAKISDPRARIPFGTKLRILEALDLLRADLFVCIRRINALRNELAHDSDRAITVDDVDTIQRDLLQALNWSPPTLRIVDEGASTAERLIMVFALLAAQFIVQLDNARGNRIRFVNERNPTTGAAGSPPGNAEG